MHIYSWTESIMNTYLCIEIGEDIFLRTKSKGVHIMNAQFVANCAATCRDVARKSHDMLKPLNSVCSKS